MAPNGLQGDHIHNGANKILYWLMGIMVLIIGTFGTWLAMANYDNVQKTAEHATRIDTRTTILEETNKVIIRSQENLDKRIGRLEDKVDLLIIPRSK